MQALENLVRVERLATLVHEVAVALDLLDAIFACLFDSLCCNVIIGLTRYSPLASRWSSQ